MFKNVAQLHILELFKSLNHLIVGQMKADSLRNFKQSYLKVKLIFLKHHVIYLLEISEKNCLMAHLEGLQHDLLELKTYMQIELFYYKY